MNEIIKIAGFALAATGIAILMKQYKPEYAFGISILFGLGVFTLIFSEFTMIFGKIENVFVKYGIEEEYYSAVFKCFGISMITVLASETCKDSSQGSIATKITLAGNVLALVNAFPLFETIISIIEELFAL